VLAAVGELTHASFFSGVGGLDIGLERAGWRTVSFSEIDPYASAVLAERWSGVPNLGDIVGLAGAEEPVSHRVNGADHRGSSGSEWEQRAPASWHHATLWSGGFPCQDLSVAGKRAGFAGARSGLAFAFLALVERYRPPAVLLENVPGLLSSHHGRDVAALVGLLGELGYGWAYRVLDAQHFGVPQRRRRVFIVALDAQRGPGADRAAEVLSVGSRCDRHPPAGVEAGPGAAEGVGERIAGTLGSVNVPGRAGQDNPTDFLIGSPPDAGGVRAPDGLAGRLDDRGGVANALDQRRGRADDNEAQAGHLVLDDFATADSDLLPLGLDSHRYRCCGNGVVSSVAEWVGLRLAEVFA
jgi:DNA (cytosine-5)-methyltransferase 1